MKIEEPRPGGGHGSEKSRLAAGLTETVPHRAASQLPTSEDFARVQTVILIATAGDGTPAEWLQITDKDLTACRRVHAWASSEIETCKREYPPLAGTPPDHGWKRWALHSEDLSDVQRGTVMHYEKLQRYVILHDDIALQVRYIVAYKRKLQLAYRAALGQRYRSVDFVARWRTRIQPNSRCRRATHSPRRPRGPTDDSEPGPPTRPHDCDGRPGRPAR